MGDCVGVEAAAIARRIGYTIVCHPPVKQDLRGLFASDVYRPENTHFARNRAIVDQTDFLIVVPYQNAWQPSGGTWYTHDYALKKNKPFQVFWPE